MGRSEDPAKPKPLDREAKLAQALRANLRRRKAEAASKDGLRPAAAAKKEG